MKFKTEITARYAETDRMGIVHHAVYPIWLEEARSQWMASTGISYSEIEKMGVMLPVTSLSCRYFASCTYEDVLTILVRIDSISAARISFYYEIFKNEQKILSATTEHAWVDANTFRPISVKKRLPNIYEILEKAKSADE